jgi:hypothetical protein
MNGKKKSKRRREMRFIDSLYSKGVYQFNNSIVGRSSMPASKDLDA